MTIIVNAYSTRRELPVCGFPHQLIATRDRSDAELASHLQGFMGFVSDHGARQMTSTLYAVLLHLQRVQHHTSLQVEQQDLVALADWGWQSNSIFYLPDGTVRDPAGAVLVDPETGQAQPEAAVPHPADAVQRARRNEQQLIQMGIPICDDLPPVCGEDELILRSPDEVAWRCLALFIVAVRAESLAGGSPISVQQLRAKSPLAFEAMSPRETAFVHDDQPDQQAVVESAWRYEALYALQWALGLHDELKFPDQICDVPLVAETMLGKPARDLVNEARLRPAAEILDAVDRNQRMLWAARQARIAHRDAPAGLDGGVLSERQHALNWLIRFGETAWDDVDTPT